MFSRKFEGRLQRKVFLEIRSRQRHMLGAKATGVETVLSMAASGACQPDTGRQAGRFQNPFHPCHGAP